jgi:hypothetical protein
LKTGETWIYPLRLKKGIRYSISTSASEPAMSLKSSLLNHHKRPICESEKGRKNRIFFVPEENGFHKIMVAMDEKGGRSKSGSPSSKVIITVRKEHEPHHVLYGSVLNKLFGITGYG